MPGSGDSVSREGTSSYGQRTGTQLKRSGGCAAGPVETPNCERMTVVKGHEARYGRRRRADLLALAPEPERNSVPMTCGESASTNETEYVSLGLPSRARTTAQTMKCGLRGGIAVRGEMSTIHRMVGRAPTCVCCGSLGGRKRLDGRPASGDARNQVRNTLAPQPLHHVGRKRRRVPLRQRNRDGHVVGGG